MRRRDVIKVIGGGAAAWPLAARAQQPGRMRLIGVLIGWADGDPATQSLVAAFRDALAQLGWTEGRNLRTELRWGNGNAARIEAFAKGAGRSETRCDLGSDHARDRCSCTRPGGGIIVTPDPFNVANRDLIIAQAARYRVPTIYFNRSFADSGGLIVYGDVFADQFRRAAQYIDRVLKGEKPADLPVQAPTKFELIINLKTAKALGLTVPPTLLTRADEVIE
jgi:hypothetical protein